jgi:hypothetical protein
MALAAWIRDAESGSMAAETGKPQVRTLRLGEQDTDRLLLRFHLTCESRQFATREIEGELAEFATLALD